MTIRFGANPIIWSNDDLRELGADIPLETCLAQARQIGFEGMELGHKFPRGARELAAVLDRFGLACVSGWYSASLLARDAAAELAHLRAHLDLLKAVGSTVLVFAEVSGAVHADREKPLAQRPRLAPGDWREFAGASRRSLPLPSPRAYSSPITTIWAPWCRARRISMR